MQRSTAHWPIQSNLIGEWTSLSLVTLDRWKIIFLLLWTLFSWTDLYIFPVTYDGPQNRRSVPQSFLAWDCQVGGELGAYFLYLLYIVCRMLLQRCGWHSWWVEDNANVNRGEVIGLFEWSATEVIRFRFGRNRILNAEFNKKHFQRSLSEMYGAIFAE